MKMGLCLLPIKERFCAVLMLLDDGYVVCVLWRENDIFEVDRNGNRKEVKNTEPITIQWEMILDTRVKVLDRIALLEMCILFHFDKTGVVELSEDDEKFYDALITDFAQKNEWIWDLTYRLFWQHMMVEKASLERQLKSMDPTDITEIKKLEDDPRAKDFKELSLIWSWWESVVRESEEVKLKVVRNTQE